MNQAMTMTAEQSIDMNHTNGIVARARNQAGGMLRTLRSRAYLLDSRIRTSAARADQGAATAEYAVVLIGATGFAALLVTLLKSDTVKTLLTNLVKKALNVG